MGEVCIITACNQLLFKYTFTKSICILAYSYVWRWWGITETFKLILVYIQHAFRCSINETANYINLVLLINCSTNNGKIGYSGEFYSMAMITLDMTIFKEIGQLLLQYQFKYKLYQPKLCLAKFDQVALKLL